MPPIWLPKTWGRWKPSIVQLLRGMGGGACKIHGEQPKLTLCMLPKGIKRFDFPNEGSAGLWCLFLERMFATVFNRYHRAHSRRISSDEEEKRMIQPKRFYSGEGGRRRAAADVFTGFNVQKGECVFGLGGSASTKCPDCCLELFKDLRKPSFLFWLWFFNVWSDWMDKDKLISFSSTITCNIS